MSSQTRRQFMISAGATSVAALNLRAANAAGTHTPAEQDFDFIFFTDTHLQPELDAAKGCDMAFKKMRTLPADFAIQGGDHVFDAMAVPKSRALSLFEMYDKTQQDLSVKVYHTIGNHDLVGLMPASGVEPSDPLYGKKYYADHIGKLYYSFEHKGVHFIVLDSIGMTADRSYEGCMDADQIAWLKADLAMQPMGKAIIVVTHIPLVTAVGCYAPPPPQAPKHDGGKVINSPEILPLFEGHNVLAVLQGHWHINERVDWHGIPYITSGAVSGNWWHGTHLGAAEGYTVVSVRGGRLTTRYETYGFQSVEPRNT